MTDYKVCQETRFTCCSDQRQGAPNISRSYLLQNAHRDVEVLLKWQQLPPCENSWELACACEIQHLFPQFHLEDEIPLQRESIDRRGKPSI